MRQPARAGLPVGVAHRLRLDPDGAGLHDPRPVGGDRGAARPSTPGCRCSRSTSPPSRPGCAADGQLLSWPPTADGEIVVDNRAAGVTRAGVWVASTAIGGYHGAGLRARRQHRQGRQPAALHPDPAGGRQLGGPAALDGRPEPGQQRPGRRGARRWGDHPGGRSAHLGWAVGVAGDLPVPGGYGRQRADPYRGHRRVRRGRRGPLPARRQPRLLEDGEDVEPGTGIFRVPTIRSPCWLPRRIMEYA